MDCVLLLVKMVSANLRDGASVHGKATIQWEQKQTWVILLIKIHVYHFHVECITIHTTSEINIDPNPSNVCKVFIAMGVNHETIMDSCPVYNLSNSFRDFGCNGIVNFWQTIDCEHRHRMGKCGGGINHILLIMVNILRHDMNHTFPMHRSGYFIRSCHTSVIKRLTQRSRTSSHSSNNHSRLFIHVKHLQDIVCVVRIFLHVQCVNTSFMACVLFLVAKMSFCIRPIPLVIGFGPNISP